MSPTRPSDSRRNSSTSFKPYTRGVSPIITQPTSPLQPQYDGGVGPPFQPESPTTSSPPHPQPPRVVEHHGFPTYNQYKQVEATYLNSLTPRRQGKALISQSLFDRIWDVLQQPDLPGETAQFRFWARKMFTISRNHPITLGLGDSPFPSDSDSPTGSHGSGGGPREVLLHDNLLVAIQEQLYDLLCYCHGSTGHGGRDKTCALIRKHYTWVPKDLVSNFIKACPTCIMKKCGGFDSSSLVAAQAASMSPMGTARSPFNDVRPEDIPLPLGSDFSGSGSSRDSLGGSALSSPYGQSPSLPWSNAGSPNDPAHSSPASPREDDLLEAAYREAFLRARNVSDTPESPLQELRGHPMTREVSLYQGLPNGWQYRYPDYATAHAEFMKTRDQQLAELGSSPAPGDFNQQGHSQHPHYPFHQQNPSASEGFQRPRIPSIVPLWGPNDYPCGDFGDVTTDDLLGHMSTNADHGSVGSSSMDDYIPMRHDLNNGHGNEDGRISEDRQQFLDHRDQHDDSSMSRSMISRPEPQIDPFLLALGSGRDDGSEYVFAHGQGVDDAGSGLGLESGAGSDGLLGSGLDPDASFSPGDLAPPTSHDEDYNDPAFYLKTDEVDLFNLPVASVSSLQPSNCYPPVVGGEANSGTPPANEQPGDATSKRTGLLPSPLDLDALSTARSFLALMAYRDTLADREANTPDSPFLSEDGQRNLDGEWETAALRHGPSPSPTSSEGSYTSGLSAFPIGGGSGGNGLDEVSPLSSAIPTPTDEKGAAAGGMPSEGNMKDCGVEALVDGTTLALVQLGDSEERGEAASGFGLPRLGDVELGVDIHDVCAR